jgi:hypothetical protein
MFNVRNLDLKPEHIAVTEFMDEMKSEKVRMLTWNNIPAYSKAFRIQN